MIFLRAHTGKPPGKAYLSPPHPHFQMVFPSFGKSPVSPALISLCVNLEAPGAPSKGLGATSCHFHPHTTHKDPVQPHGSDGDNAKPNRQQKPLEPSLFLDLGRRKADLGGRSLEIDSCLLPRRLSKGDQPTADSAVVHKTFSRCPWSLLSRTSSGPLLLPKYNPKVRRGERQGR